MQTIITERNYLRHILHHYNRHAYFYDTMEFLRWDTRRKAIVLSGWQPGEKVLDLCTGTGELALKFVSQGVKVVGTDIARGMLKRALGKNSRLKSLWVEMDATELAFADHSFEISLLSLALHHMPISVQVRVLQELRRVTSRRIVLIEPEVPIDRRWVPLWTFVASIIDESEYMHEWVHQDLTGTCRIAGLNVEAVHKTTVGLHQILICNPTGIELKTETACVAIAA
jgi:ubiquinone/menaquinone biosynthesis C-methylase UbiE